MGYKMKVYMCRTACQDSDTCSTFTHYGENSAPFQNVCMLLTSCEV